jgi:hypothetical protein
MMRLTLWSLPTPALLSTLSVLHSSRIRWSSLRDGEVKREMRPPKSSAKKKTNDGGGPTPPIPSPPTDLVHVVQAVKSRCSSSNLSPAGFEIDHGSTRPAAPVSQMAFISNIVQPKYASGSSENRKRHQRVNHLPATLLGKLSVACISRFWLAVCCQR